MSSAGIVSITLVLDESILPFSPAHGLESSDSILIYFAMLGSVVPMRVLVSESIETLKLRIQTCKGFIVKNQKLVCGRREMSTSNSMIRDYGITDGSVLHLVLRLSDLQLINVRTSCGKEFNFHVERSRDVGYVKRQIAKRSDLVDLDDQEVLCDVEQIEDQRLINDICKHNDAVIHLFVRKPAKIRVRPVEKNFELYIVAPQ